MKKWFLFLLMVVFITIKGSIVKADSNYQAFEDIEIKTGMFLSDYTDDDYKEYYKKVTKRRFFGWNTHTVTKKAKVTYTTETLFSYYNDGFTPIDYSYEMKRKSLKSINLTSTGSIHVKTDGQIEKFKGGLDSSLKVTTTNNSSTEVQENFKMSLKIDAGTMLNLFIAGEGHITNGVAANYVFWIRRDMGGFEIFVVTTQYYRLEKVQI